MQTITANVTCTSANTEYSVEIPNFTRGITIQCRTAHVLRVAFEAGKVAAPTAPYYSIKSGAVLTLSPVTQIRNKLYVGAPDAGSIAEVLFSM